MKINLLKPTLYLLWSIMLTATVNGQWQQKGADFFGSEYDSTGSSISVSADGNTLALGAYLADPNGSSSGNMRVFSWNGNQWAQRGQTLEGEAANYKFGYSASLTPDGNRLAVGATGAMAGGRASAGHVKVFEWNGTSWQQLGPTIGGVLNDINSGWSVSLDENGNTVAISAPLAGPSGTQIGEVRVYTFDGTDWNQMGSAIEGENQYDYMGHCIKLSADGTRVAIGTHMNDDFATDAGSVDIYEWSGTQWNQMGNRLTGTEETDWFGKSLDFSADGNRLAIGAWHHGADRGQVRAFEWDGTQWQQLGQAIDGENDNYNFGHSVALSADGTTLVAGAVQHPGGGDLRGQTRVYRLVGNTWYQVDSGINGLDDGDFGGYNTAISASGETVVIGMPLSSSHGTYTGAVRVYEGGVLGTQDLLADKKILAFPNPTHDRLMLKLPKTSETIMVAQYSLLGQVVASKRYNDMAEISFEMQGTPGLYLVCVTTRFGVQSFQILKN